jgi:hypothetical protein
VLSSKKPSGLDLVVHFPGTRKWFTVFSTWRLDRAAEELGGQLPGVHVPSKGGGGGGEIDFTWGVMGAITVVGVLGVINVGIAVG